MLAHVLEGKLALEMPQGAPVWSRKLARSCLGPMEARPSSAQLVDQLKRLQPANGRRISQSGVPAGLEAGAAARLSAAGLDVRRRRGSRARSAAGSQRRRSFLDVDSAGGAYSDLDVSDSGSSSGDDEKHDTGGIHSVPSDSSSSSDEDQKCDMEKRRTTATEDMELTVVSRIGSSAV